MEQQYTLHVRVSVASEQSAGGNSGLTQSALDAIEQVGTELRDEGMAASVRRDETTTTGERGFGIDDILVGLTVNAISTFFLRIFDDLQKRFTRHRNVPRAIVFESGGRRVQVPATAPVMEVADQINEWARSIADAHDVTITIVR